MKIVCVPARARARCFVLYLACVPAALWLLPGLAGAAQPTPVGKVLTFEGACDASAVVELAPGQLLVGDDGNNILRLYPPGGGAIEGEIDVYELTNVGALSKRNLSAIEGAARLGDRIYWIGSHARMRGTGKNRPNRRRLFSLEVSEQSGRESAAPVGQWFEGLSAAIEQAPELKPLRLDRSIMLQHRAMEHLDPDRNGLNIEGLAAGTDGRSLLIGLRNPVRRGDAIILQLLNPQDLVSGSKEAYFGDPIILKLGRRGISSIEYSPARGGYYILAGMAGQSAGYRLYSWSGQASAAPVLVRDLSDTGLNAQALAISGDGKRAVILSDDGDVPLDVEDRKACRRVLTADGKCACTHVKDASRKSFRGMWLKLE